jgi:predicted metal-dependent peptidase
MIDERAFKSKDALALAQDAVSDLVLRAQLMGLSLLGESVRIQQDDSIQTMCTDGRNIRMSSKWLEKNGLRGNVFDTLHEWLHIFSNHVVRRGARDPKIWNVACDMVVVRMASEILSRPGDPWPYPKDGVIPADWSKDLSAEEIYDRLIDDPDAVKEATKNASSGEHQNGGDFDYDSADEYSEEEEEQFYQRFTEELAQAQLITERSSGSIKDRYGDAVASRLSEVLKGTIPWGKLLRGDLIDAITQQFATWSPPKRKYYPTLIMPSYRSTRERKLLLGIDVSASVGQDLMKVFISNVMPAAARAKETIIVTFDQVIRETVITNRPASVLNSVKFLSGAHSYTDVRPVFDLVEQHRPSAVAILTDAYLCYPDKPHHSTLWAVPKTGGAPPWGKTYRMETSW